MMIIRTKYACMVRDQGINNSRPPLGLERIYPSFTYLISMLIIEEKSLSEYTNLQTLQHMGDLATLIPTLHKGIKKFPVVVMIVANSTSV